MFEEYKIKYPKEDVTRTPFEKAAAEKFQKGAREHQEDWNSLNPIPEISNELLDLYNYASHPALYETELGVKIMNFARDTWERLN
jgi:hypothetical protein